MGRLRRETGVSESPRLQRFAADVALLRTGIVMLLACSGPWEWEYIEHGFEQSGVRLGGGFWRFWSGVEGTAVGR